jgi:tetratricopeptide (TPR) repeat protein
VAVCAARYLAFRSTYILPATSLEALKAYSLGPKANNEKGFTAALSYYQHAIQLDPNFAIGYRAVGAAYGSLGEMDRANDYYTRAFQLREHTANATRS